jgi:hypothetical protein
MSKRNILGELMEGVAAMKGHREGKLTRRCYKVESTLLPKVDSKLIRDTDCIVLALSSPRSCGATKGHLRSGDKAAEDRILKQQLWFCWSAGTLTHLPPDRKLSTFSLVHWFTLRRVDSSMAKGGTRDRVNADDGLLPGIRLC